MKSYDIFESPYYNLLGALIRAERAVNRHAEKSGEKSGKSITSDQQYICDILKVIKSGTIADFTRLLIREPSSVSQMLKRMESKGFIKSMTLPDTKKLVYELNEPENISIGLVDINDICKNVFSGLTENEQVELRRLLDKLFDSTVDKLKEDHNTSPFSKIYK